MYRPFALSSALALLCSVASAQAAPLTVYCPMSDDDCGSVLAAFSADTNNEARFVRIGAGAALEIGHESLSRVKKLVVAQKEFDYSGSCLSKLMDHGAL